ncbi:LamG-like jellyroll fold domain-containing protein [Aeoliella sp. SH292]|uniref:LamG-like jellyroll fold domain-containing protein n=1 Tax=Aeoliella sp. SH292 TaxID=3454464 RepID=UPI003F9749C3
MIRLLLATLMLSCAFVFSSWAVAHEGPDPVAHWVFKRSTIRGSECRAVLGPDLTLSHSPRIVSDRFGSAIDLTHSEGVVATSSDLGKDSDLPTEAITISAWLAIDEAEERGGIVGACGDKAEFSWLVGYDSTHLTFELRIPSGAVLLRSNSKYEKGQWIHVVAVYDGSTAELYVNGELEAEKAGLEGQIEYSDNNQYVVGGIPGASSNALRGKLREVSVYDMAAKAAWVTHAFSHLARLTELQPGARNDQLSMVVSPYLQNGTQDGMTVMWQTSIPASSTVHYGPTAECSQTVGADEVSEIHEVRITGLEPETQYFYRVESTDDSGQQITSDVSTFSTAVLPGTPFAYVVISDTQGSPVVASQLSKHAWAQRPSFLLHPGDLVDTGVNDAHWTQHFFPGMQELISRVPMYPVLGNHEQNASNYFEYMSLPKPEYYYDFRYGDAHFFMVDSNRNVGPDSEQYQWLDEQLAKSDAKWKFACHHHPPYSSDEDDYGDLWKVNESTRGDVRVRQLVKLYEKHGVDIVWTGHIHSYERTWPVKDGKAANDNAPMYMIVGGGGGNLETPAPSRPYFQNQVRRGHHYVMVHVNGNTLELRSYDLDDRMFDTVRLAKP